MRLTFVLTLSVTSVLSLLGCVPKTQYDDQQSKLQEMQNKVRALESSSSECDKETYLQMREQSQSLDLLTQELVNRNTELSKEVARLRVFESASKNENQSCAQRMYA